MPLTPGLSPSIRQPDTSGLGALLSSEAPMVDIIVDEAGVTTDKPPKSAKKVLSIEHEDGSITISLDGKSLEDDEDDANPLDWFDNLVDRIPDAELSKISSDLLRGVEDDLESRNEWMETRALGIKLLGLKIEIPGLQGASDGAPVEGMSKVRHPLLLEAVLRFQANARSELLPTDGPAKIRNDDNNTTLEEDQLADAFEVDLNHYLTTTATEYYPDTDRMLLMLGFGGTAFKKIYLCPLRNRPVSETVDANDLIVNNAATDLENAKRITHRSFMRPSTLKRLQILGVYRDIDLSTPLQPKIDSVRREKNDQQGISSTTSNPEDRDREIYECYCELDLPGFEHKWKGKTSGLEIPYRVTIDVSSKKILSIVRNYDEDTEELPIARETFIKYTFVPGMGFYDIGLVHILGNTTNAITAAWREMLDAGMYSNFPGFLMADTGARQNTNIFRVPPGGGALVKTNGMPINQAIMPLPYKEPSSALMTLIDNMSQTGMRIGGTSEQQVGEGKTEMPVGTTLAMMDQAAKVMNSVHKRLCSAQAKELQLIAKVFKENPKAFWQRNRAPATKWDEETFLKALNDFDLIPQADPNTASHGQRLMKISGLKQLQSASPNMYDAFKVDSAALQALGWSNPQQFMKNPEELKKPSPQDQAMQAKAQAEKTVADARMLDSQTRQKATEAKIHHQSHKEIVQNVKVQQEGSKAHMENRVDQQKAIMEQQRALLDLAKDIATNPEYAEQLMPLIQPAVNQVQQDQAALGTQPPMPPKPPGVA